MVKAATRQDLDGKIKTWKVRVLGPFIAQFVRLFILCVVLIKTRDKLLAELGELNKKKRYGSAEEAAKSDCAGLESRLAVLEKEMVI